jgi:uncharacterized membrane protein YfhO
MGNRERVGNISSGKTYLYLPLAFLIPALSLLFVYAKYGFYPFGDKSLLVMDLSYQYVDFYEYLRRAMLEGNSLLYSWTKGIGGNMLGLFSYYLSSPFSFLLVLFPENAMTEAVMFLNIFKAGLCGLAMSVYLRHMNRGWDLHILIFSTLYALMSYVVVYSMCLMWLDAVIWLPIILLGVERILSGKKAALFLASYTLLLTSNYYTAYMVTIFIAIYFVYRYICTNESFNAKEFFDRLLIITGCGLIGVGLSAWLLLPSVNDLISGKLAANSYVPGGFFNQNYLAIPKRLYMGGYDSITNYGLPAVYTGAITALLVVMYFINGGIKRREKLATAAVLGIFLLSFAVKGLDMAWHVFQYPNWFPYRYAFIFCFFVIYTAFRGFTNIDALKRSRTGMAGGALAMVLLVIPIFSASGAISSWSYVSILLTAVYTVMLVFKKGVSKPLTAALLLLCTVEMSANSLLLVEGVDGEFGYTLRSEYTNASDEPGREIRRLQETDPGFYRIEKTFSRSDNDSMNIGYKGMSHYSSNYDEKFNIFDYRMGMLQEYIACRYQGGTMAMEGLFGVKYIVSDRLLNDSYPIVSEFSGYRVYENPYALSLGFAVPDAVYENINYTNDFLHNQNSVLEAVSGTGFYYTPHNLSFKDNGFSFTAADSNPVYLSAPDKFTGGLEVYVNDKQIAYEYDINQKRCYYVGKFESGQEVSVVLPGKYAAGVNVYVFDEEKFSAWAESKKTEQLEITEYTDTRIDGRITVEGEKTMLATISYNEGWRAYIDGEKAETRPALDTFLSVSIPAGTHDIRLVFTPVWFIPGIAVSCITVTAVAVYAAYIRWKRSKGRGGPA